MARVEDMQALKSRKKILMATSVLYIAILTIIGIHCVGAVSWSDYENRLTTQLEFDGLPAIMQTTDGKMWILWQKEHLDNDIIVYVTSADMGNSWSTEELLISGGQNTHPSIVQLADSTIWLFWASDRTGNYEIFYRISSDLGASWSNDTQLTNNTCYDACPSIATTKDGSFWLFWATKRTGNYEIFYKIYNGTTWCNDTQLTNDPALDKSPSAIQTRDGDIWVTWFSDRHDNFEVLYNIHNGTQWSGDMRLTDDSNTDTVPSLLETIDGKIWIFWASCPPQPPGTDDIYYKYTIDKGVTWSDPVQLSTDKYDDTWPAVFQTSDTALWVFWTSDRADQPDYGNYDVWYRTSLVGDVNSDGVVDVYDLASVALAFGTSPGDDHWNPEADINKDGVVDIDDLILVARNYGST